MDSVLAECDFCDPKHRHTLSKTGADEKPPNFADNRASFPRRAPSATTAVVAHAGGYRLACSKRCTFADVQEEDLTGTLAPGTIVGGRFKINRLIGRGGMGEVYAAQHVNTSKEVALKIIHTAASASKEQTRRFMREARAATAIEHPNVIEVFDVFEDANGTAVMVMELLKGEPFARILRARGALELHEVATILLPSIRALHAAHEKGIVHRDLKPDNIFVSTTASGERVTKLLDFGIAKILDPARLGSETQGQATNTGSLLGTPHYMSHEQAMSDKDIDARTDVWSMGVIVFEALAGRRPLVFETLGEMYKAFLQDEVPSILRLIPDLPAELAAALDHCLQKQSAERATSVAPLIAELEKYTNAAVPGAKTGGRVVAAFAVSETPVETKAPVSTSVVQDSTRKSRVPWFVGGTGVLVAVIAGGFGVSRVTHNTGPQPAAEDAAPNVLATLPSATNSVDRGTTRVDAAIATSSATPSVSAVRPRFVPSAQPLGFAGDSGSVSTKHGIVETDPYGGRDDAAAK